MDTPDTHNGQTYKRTCLFVCLCLRLSSALMSASCQILSSLVTICQSYCQHGRVYFVWLRVYTLHMQFACSYSVYQQQQQQQYLFSKMAGNQGPNFRQIIR